ATVKEPDAWETERARDRGDLAHIGRAGAHKPATRHVIDEGEYRARQTREPCHAIVAQSSRAVATHDGAAQRAALAQVDDGDVWERSLIQHRPSFICSSGCPRRAGARAVLHAEHHDNASTGVNLRRVVRLREPRRVSSLAPSPRQPAASTTPEDAR